MKLRVEQSSTPTSWFALAAAVLLVFVSVSMVVQAYGAYESAKLAKPSIAALSPGVVRSRVLAEAVPALRAGATASSASSFVESLAEQATVVHQVASAQADAQARMAGVQAVAWGAVLVMGIVIVSQLLPRRSSGA
jgi:hypothetical protein